MNNYGDIMESRKQNTESRQLKCHCGKLVAIVRDGTVYVYCKGCKRQVAVCKTEPRA